MSTDRDTTRIVLSWLRVDERVSADRLLDGVLTAVDTTAQRQPSWLARRTPTVNKVIGFGLAAAAVVIVVFIGFQLVGGPNVLGPSPTESPPPRPTPQATDRPSAIAEPSPLPIYPTDWTTVVSTQYGFSIAHPPNWTYTPADHDWTVEDAPFADGSTDLFTSPDGTVAVSVWSVLPETELINATRPVQEAWIEEYCRATNNEPCDTIPEQSLDLCIERADCHPALLTHFTNDVQAFLPGQADGDRMVIVAVWQADSDPAVAFYGGSQNLLEAFLRAFGPHTICLKERCSQEPY
jgi:hypothetical protein